MPFLFKKKGSKYWQIGWYDPKTGKSGKPESTKCVNKKDAETALKLFSKKLEQEKKDKSSFNINPELTILKAYDHYKRYRENIGKKLSPKTTQSYDIALNKYFIPTCKDKPVYEYNKNDYNIFVEAMSKLSQNSRSVYTKNIYSLFNWLRKEDYIKTIPVRRVAEENKPVQVHTKEEIVKFLKYARTTKFYYMSLYELISAFRIHEVLKVRPRDIQKTQIKITGKGSKHASIPIIKKNEKTSLCAADAGRSRRADIPVYEGCRLAVLSESLKENRD